MPKRLRTPMAIAVLEQSKRMQRQALSRGGVQGLDLERLCVEGPLCHGPFSHHSPLGLKRQPGDTATPKRCASLARPS
jgi:hypothetical protein